MRRIPAPAACRRRSGLRFFVDALLEIGDIGDDRAPPIEAEVARRLAGSRTLEGALAEATSLLSGLTRGAGVVVTSKDNARLKHIEFLRLEPERALAILVAEDGSVENRVVPTPPGLPASALVEAANYLNARIRGRTLAEARAEIEAERRAAETELDHLTERLVDAGLAELGRPAGRGAPAHRARPGQPARGPHRARRPRAHPPALRRPRNQDGRHRPAATAPRRARACASSSARRTSCSRCRAPPWSRRPFRDGQQRIVGVLGIIGPTRLELRPRGADGGLHRASALGSDAGALPRLRRPCASPSPCRRGS